MPQVPQYGLPLVSREVVRQPMLGAESFGAKEGKALQDVAGIALGFSQEIDKTKARTLLNQAIPEIDGVYKEHKLKNAGVLATPESYKAFNDKMREKTQSLTKGLSPFARDLVMTELGSRLAVYNNDWNTYSLTEQEKARVSSLEVENDRLANDIAQGVEVDSFGISNRDAILANIMSANPGMTKDVGMAKANAVVGKSLMTKTFSLMESDPVQAMDYFSKHREDLSAFDPLATEKLAVDLRDRYAKQQALVKATDLIALNMSEGKALESINKLPEDQREFALEAFRSKKQAIEIEANRVIGQIEADQMEFLSGADANILAIYTPPANAPENVKNSLMAYRNSLLASLSSAKAETDWGQYIELSDMAVLSPNEFLSVDLKNYNLAPSELDKLINRRTELLKNGKGEAPDSYLMSSVGLAINSIMDGTITGTITGIKDKAKGWVAPEMNRWAEEFNKANKRFPSKTEIDNKATELSLFYKNNKDKIGVLGLSKVSGAYKQAGDIAKEDRKSMQALLDGYGLSHYTKGKYMSDNLVKLGNAILSGKLDPIYQRVPEQERALGEIELAEEGITPTREALFNWYLRHIMDETPLVKAK